MFKPDDKVYFHRGPVELVGVIESVGPGSVTLLGVETGFRATQRTRITVAELDYLCAMDDETFATLTRDEPAFSNPAGSTPIPLHSQKLQDLAEAA